MAHEGDLARFDGVFYWYGSSYANNPEGKFDIADGPVWNGVQVYRSTDLKNWTHKGVACLAQKTVGRTGSHGPCARHLQREDQEVCDVVSLVFARPRVLPHGGRCGSPEGPFTSLGPREMGPVNRRNRERIHTNGHE